MTHHSRRDFMRLACCSAATASLVGGLSKFGLVSALAQSHLGLQGAGVHFSFRRQRREQYDRADRYELRELRIDSREPRDPAGIAVAVADRERREFWISSELCRSCRDCSTIRKIVAVLNNVGTLVQPTTQQQYQHQGTVPENLFSHSDQQDQWQTTQLSGLPNAGWAGKIADNLQPTFNSTANFPPVLSVAGSTIFGTGVPIATVHDEPGKYAGTCRESIVRRPGRRNFWGYRIC